LHIAANADDIDDDNDYCCKYNLYITL